MSKGMTLVVSYLLHQSLAQHNRKRIIAEEKLCRSREGVKCQREHPEKENSMCSGNSGCWRAADELWMLSNDTY